LSTCFAALGLSAAAFIASGKSHFTFHYILLFHRLFLSVFVNAVIWVHSTICSFSSIL
jgi:hypothetical protein